MEHPVNVAASIGRGSSIHGSLAPVRPPGQHQHQQRHAEPDNGIGEVRCGPAHELSARDATFSP